jgi:RHS repeat-associated protein
MANYYPFGMEMDMQTTQVGTPNDYTYNGKEMNSDFGLNLSDYGARWYDASIGRWNSVDPLAEKYSSMSTYVYAGNSPTLNIDPDGRSFFNSNFMNKGGGHWTDQAGFKSGSDKQDEAHTRKMKGATYTGANALIAFNMLNNGSTSDNVIKSINKLETKFSALREKSKDGEEYGLVIYYGNDGNLYESNTINGTEYALFGGGTAKKIIYVNELDNPTAKNKDNVLLELAGFYHTHPNRGDDMNPFSVGDAEGIIQAIMKGAYWKDWGKNAYFSIADDLNGGRYVGMIEDYSKASKNIYNTMENFNKEFDAKLASYPLGISAGVQHRLFFKSVFTEGSGIGIYYSQNYDTKLNRIK